MARTRLNVGKGKERRRKTRKRSEQRGGLGGHADVTWALPRLRARALLGYPTGTPPKAALQTPETSLLRPAWAAERRGLHVGVAIVVHRGQCRRSLFPVATAGTEASEKVAGDEIVAEGLVCANYHPSAFASCGSVE